MHKEGEDIFKPTIRNESLCEVTGDNGVRVVKFATSENIIAMRTMFPHQHIHNYIWTSPDWITRNHVDHILKDKRQHSCVVHIWSFRGAEVLRIVLESESGCWAYTEEFIYKN